LLTFSLFSAVLFKMPSVATIFRFNVGLGFCVSSFLDVF